jgi:hypothetical protein
MNQSKFTAPNVDILLDSLPSGFHYEPEILNIESIPHMLSIDEEINYRKVQGEDENRSFWISAKRGKIEDFGSYEVYFGEGEVNSKEEFTELWLSYYPKPVKWYLVTYAKFRDEIFIYIDSKLIIHADKNSHQGSVLEKLSQILSWLDCSISEIVKRLKQNPNDYCNYLEKNLPYEKRIGKIRRKLIWDIFPESKAMIVNNLTEIDIQDLSKWVESTHKSKLGNYLKKMNAHDFYNFCQMAYVSISEYQKKLEKLSPKEMYYAMADGRDCGLKDIDLESYKAFEEWYNHERLCGGHPWEILRGGNSTHISLYIEHVKGHGWILRLNGSSFVRVNETIHIALAFFRAGVPFILDQAHEIKNMACGTDFIGIVNDLTLPRYCHSLFPPEDKIIDFMNLPFENREELINKAEWCNIEKIELS